MPRYEIRIKDNESGNERFISCESLSDFSDTLNAKTVVVICNKAFHAGGTVPKTNPSYSRQEILREEWIPRKGESFGLVRPDNSIEFGFYSTTQTTASIWRDRGYVFVPIEHPEWAEEIVQIRKGEWGPKPDDMVFTHPKNTGLSEGRYITGKYFIDRWCHTHYAFPTEKQKTTFISQQKKEKSVTFQNETTLSEIFTSMFEKRVKPSREELREMNRKIKSFFETIVPLNDARIEMIYQVLFTSLGDGLKRDSEGYTDETDVRYKEWSINSIARQFEALHGREIYVDKDGFLKLKP